MDTLIREYQFCKKELDYMLQREIEIKSHMADLKREAINQIQTMIQVFDIPFTEMIKIYELKSYKAPVTRSILDGLEEDEYND